MRKLTLLLNSELAGPHAWFFLAQQRGYFSRAGIEPVFVAGTGAAAIVPRVGAEAFDMGYGCLNALIDLVANDRPAPIGVYCVFNRSPFTIAVRADGPVSKPADLVGKLVTGHADDAALKVFPAFADQAGFPVQAVRTSTPHEGLGEQVRSMLAGDGAEGIFGFVNTIIAACALCGIDATRELRFIEFADYMPDLYGNALMVSRDLVAREPELVRSFVAAVNRGLAETVQDHNAAIAAVAHADPSINVEVQKRRMIGTLRSELSHPEGARLGVGDVDDARLKRSIALLVRTCGLPRAPGVGEVFTRSFLPQETERVRNLAR